MPRTAHEIGVHAVRAGGIIGMHEVIFAGDYDEITITHRSESRLAFAAAALDAATWIGARRGYFTVEDMIMSAGVEELLAVSSCPQPTAVVCDQGNLALFYRIRLCSCWLLIFLRT